MSDWNVGDRVVDLILSSTFKREYPGTVRRLGRRGGAYVEWDCDPGYEDFMYDNELGEYNGPE